MVEANGEILMVALVVVTQLPSDGYVSRGSCEQS